MALSIHPLHQDMAHDETTGGLPHGAPGGVGADGAIQSSPPGATGEGGAHDGACWLNCDDVLALALPRHRHAAASLPPSTTSK